MKTGAVANYLEIDSQTVRNWVDHELLSKFFSDKARGIGVRQRVFNETDIAILSTVHQLKTEFDIIEWDKLALALEARINTDALVTGIPTEATTDPRHVPYKQAELGVKGAATLAELNETRKLVDDLRARLTREEDKNKELTEEIKSLLRELGRMEGRLESYEDKD